MTAMEPGAFAADQTFQVCEGQELTEMPDGYVIYKTATEKVHYLNPAAAVVYELCAAGYSVERIGAFLKQAYELGNEPLDDAHRCLASLLQEELIRPCQTS